jgi:hypothetical protein
VRAAAPPTCPVIPVIAYICDSPSKKMKFEWDALWVKAMHSFEHSLDDPVLDERNAVVRP